MKKVAVLVMLAIGVIVLSIPLLSQSNDVDVRESVYWPPLSPADVLAQGPDQPEDPSQTSVFEEISAVESCTPPEINRDPDTSGLLDENTQVGTVESTYCNDNNTVYVAAGSKWWGDPETHMAQEMSGYILLRDELGRVVPGSFRAIEGTNTPTINGALYESFVYPLPLDGESYRFEVELNVYMIPSGIGPGTYGAFWPQTAGLGSFTFEKHNEYLLNVPVDIEHLQEDGSWLKIATLITDEDDLVEVNGAVVAQITVEGLVGPISAVTDNYRAIERLDLMPPGVFNVDPITHEKLDGVQHFRIDNTSQSPTRRFYNVDYRVFLPSLHKGYPPDTCVREIRMEYNWQGEHQSEVYQFTPVSAPVQDIGVLVIGEIVTMSMLDNNPVYEITLIRNYPDGRWDYEYTDWKGAVEKVYGAHEPIDDEEHEDAHQLQAGRKWGVQWSYFNEDNIRCMFSMQVVWDPPEETVLHDPRLLMSSRLTPERAS